jgi:exodeoxyribonuclease III
MKIATFNINNIKRRLPNLLDWLNAGKPDVVCLEELMCSEHDFPAAPIKEAGYSAGLARRKDLERAAILERHREPVLTNTALPGDSADVLAPGSAGHVGGRFCVTGHVVPRIEWARAPHYRLWTRFAQ